jgi:hypothetical protein
MIPNLRRAFLFTVKSGKKILRIERTLLRKKETKRAVLKRRGLTTNNSRKRRKQKIIRTMLKLLIP